MKNDHEGLRFEFPTSRSAPPSKSNQRTRRAFAGTAGTTGNDTGENQTVVESPTLWLRPCIVALNGVRVTIDSALNHVVTTFNVNFKNII